MVEFFGFVTIALTILLVFFISGMINDRNELKRYREKLKKEYGSANTREYAAEGSAGLCGYYRSHRSEDSLDDITWNDLNMEDIYRRMDYCKTSAGDEYLYYLLRNPKLGQYDWTDFEKKTEYYRTHAEERLQLQLILHKMGYTGKYSIYDYLDNLETLGKRSNTKDILGIVAFLLAFILCFVKLSVGLPCVFAVLIYNLTTYFRLKAQIDPYITSFRYIFRVLREIEEIRKCKQEVIRDEVEELSRLYHVFDRFMRFSYLIMSPGRMSGDMMEVGLDYIRMFLHLDIIKFNSMLAEVKKHKGEIDRMLSLIGELDTILSVGEYRTFLQDYCLPVYRKDAYEAKALYHPLLKDPVKNDVSVKRSVLITGSNASGKSTFLKTIAVNAILAQSIHTVCADQYCADSFRIFSSITLKDNILEGDSYYMTEIKSIKRILDAAKQKEEPVLSFVDEVLRGTNTTERIAASSIILQQLSKSRGFCFAATHDLELTTILKQYYDNVHFEEKIKEGDIVFPYRLQNGPATTRNAIALLKIMGYDSNITGKAQELAEHFEINKKWEVFS